jgi:hypothetical protein
MDYIYDLDEGTVRIMYARQDASRVFLPGGGNWNVAPDTVINIWVEVDFPVKKLRIRNLEKYKWYRLSLLLFASFQFLTLVHSSLLSKRRRSESYPPSASGDRVLMGLSNVVLAASRASCICLDCYRRLPALI